jgi:hypothetical protein
MVDATRDLILQAEDIELAPLVVPAWKDKDGNAITVYIKQMSGKDANEYLTTVNEENGGYDNRNAKILISTLCDANGDKLFTKNDIDELQKKNSRVLNWIVEKSLEINVKSADALEELAKN